MQADTAELEHAVSQIVDVETAIEVDGDAIVVTGIIDTDEEREAILDLLGELEPGARVVDNLAMGAVMPRELGDLRLSETESAGLPGAQPDLSEDESIEPGDFTDQTILSDQGVAAGPSGTHADDDVSEGDEVYVPPTDPASTPEGEFLGGFRTTAGQPDPVPQSPVVGGSPDAAIEEAVIAELREDAATTTLEVEATAMRGVVTLRGFVDDLEDAENAQAIASRVPGVVEVRDEIQLRASH